MSGNHDHLILGIAVAITLVGAFLYAVAAGARNLQRRNARYDAELARMRTPDMGAFEDDLARELPVYDGDWTAPR